MSFGHLPGAFLEIFFWFQKATLAVVLRGLFSPKNRVLERGGLAAVLWPPAGRFPGDFLLVSERQVAQKSPHFLCSEVTLGTFSPPFLRLVRPSLPWCFPVRGLWFCAVFPRPRTAFWSGTSSSEISSFSMFRSYVRRFFAAFFAPCPSFTAMVFPRPGAVVLRGLSSPKNRVLERDK